MKKSLSLLVSAAVALSMFATAANADIPKTSSDYTDLANVDSALKSKIDTLLSKGIFEGVSSDSFGITENMTRAQFAKVASLVFGLQVDSSIRTSSFTDVKADDSANGWAIPYIEAAKKAGLIDGMTDTTFAPGEKVTIGQLDTVLVKGLGKAVNVSATPWYADAVKQATELGIHPAGKTGDSTATRSDLVVGAYGSIQSLNGTIGNGNNGGTGTGTGTGSTQNRVSVISAQASGDKAVQVTLDQAVDTSKAALALTMQGTVIPTTVIWDSGNKSATLSLTGDTKLANGNYTVTLGGIDASAINTASLTFAVGISDTTDNVTYTLAGSYDLSSVLDSGLTSSATGANGFATRTEAEDPTTSMFAKEIKFQAFNSSGQEIAISGIVQSLSSSNPAVVKTGVSSEHKGYILGNKAGTATVDVIYTTIKGERKSMSIPVTVKSTAPLAQKIEAKTSSYNATMTVTGGVYSSQFNAYETMDLLVTDNYGIEYERDEIQRYNFALNTIFLPKEIAGDSGSPLGNVTVDAAGIVHIEGNVTMFNLTVMTPSGQEASTWVNVRKN